MNSPRRSDAPTNERLDHQNGRSEPTNVTNMGIVSLRNATEYARMLERTKENEREGPYCSVIAFKENGKIVIPHIKEDHIGAEPALLKR